MSTDENKNVFENNSGPSLKVIEESFEVTKKVIDKAKVELQKSISTENHSVNVELNEEKILVRRIPKNEIVNVIPESVRYEDGVMIISVLKEVAVVEKKMMLVEEIHVIKQQEQKTETIQVPVCREEVTITRTDLNHK